MGNTREEHTQELRARLRGLEARFESEMRARGFDPTQAENTALPSQLAALYAEREEVRAELQELLDEESET